jgi:hypothetical protein
MLFTNKIKQTEVTRVESLTLSIAQWCILHLLPEDKKNRNVFFTQINIKTVKNLNNRFIKEVGFEHKSIQLEAFFTTLEENAEHGREGCVPTRPKVSGEFLFRNEGSGFFLWVPSSFSLNVYNFEEITGYPNVGYCKQRMWSWPDQSEILRDQKKSFETFFEKLSHHAPWGKAVLTDK